MVLLKPVQARSVGCWGMDPLLEIIYEDPGLLVVNKPAGLVCHPTKTDLCSSLIGRVRLHLGPSIRPHLINRLDRETGGVVLVAKDDETARTLRRAWEQRAVDKIYLAVVHGWPSVEEGVIEAPLGPDPASQVAIKNSVRADGAPAQTVFRVLRRFTRPEGRFSLLEVRPLTGRKHQIRLHLAHLGHPVVGDKLYGGDEQLYLAFVKHRLTDEQRARLILPHQALHAVEVRLVYKDRPAVFRAEPEAWFTDFVQQGTAREAGPTECSESLQAADEAAGRRQTNHAEQSSRIPGGDRS